MLVSFDSDLAITSIFTFAYPDSSKSIFTWISPFSPIVTSVLFVPSEYIVSTLLICTSSGNLSINVISSIAISDKLVIVNVYVYFSEAAIVVLAGILQLWTMLTPVLLIVSVSSGIISAFFPSASIVPLMVISFL